MKQRVFIECTSTFINGGNSGIQRVVRNLANCGRNLSTKELSIQPIVWTSVGFCQPTSKVKVKPYFLIVLKRKIQRLLHLTSRNTPGRGLLKKPIKWIARKVLSLRQRDSIRKFLTDIPYLLMGLASLPVQLLLGRFIIFHQGDIVVMVDSTWRTQAMLDELFKAQLNSGLVVGVMLHDLFPLELPGTCQEITAKGFVSWFNHVVPRADFFVTNSESTRHSLGRYLVEHTELRPHSYPSGSFRLGAELDPVKSKGKKPDSLQPLWATPGKAILCVGTIEPRKNHNYLLDAYDLMRGRGEDISLVILGRDGWKSKAVVDRIRSHEDFGTRLLHLDNASDRDLAEAFERADCLVCPSVAEGFGLPVAEGLMHGLKVFASDIEVFREIAGANCSYFNLDDPLSLADQLSEWFDYLQQGNSAKSNEAFVWPDWEESSREFVDVVLKLADQSQKPNFELKNKRDGK